jgi:beta-lactamase class A
VLPPDLAPVDWSILVVDVGSGAKLAAQDEDRILWTASVGKLFLLVGAVSDNLATSVLLRLVGVPAVAVTTRALGYRDSAVLDRVRDDRGPQHQPTLSVGTAAELADLMRRLHQGHVMDPEVSRTVRSWLAANTDLSMVSSAFDLDPLAHAEPDRRIGLVNKTGTIASVRADVGAVEGPTATVAYAVLANWSPGEDRRDNVLADMRRIGWAIRAHVER